MPRIICEATDNQTIKVHLEDVPEPLVEELAIQINETINAFVKQHWDQENINKQDWSQSFSKSMH